MSLGPNDESNRPTADIAVRHSDLLTFEPIKKYGIRFSAIRTKNVAFFKNKNLLLGLRIVFFIKNVELLDLRARPGSAPQKRQARLNARVIGKTLDGHFLCHMLPPIASDEFSENRLERHSVQMVLGGSHPAP